MAVEQLDQLGKVRQRSGQAVDLVDHNDVHLSGADFSQQPLQRWPLGRASRIAAVIVAGFDQGPAGMGLAADIGLRSVMLSVQRVEVLLQPVVGRHAGIDRAANQLDGTALHGRTSDDGLSRPKNLGPDQRVPVIGKATIRLPWSCRSRRTRQRAPWPAAGGHPTRASIRCRASIPFGAG